MPSPSVTYTFSNSTTADATQVNQNFTDVINGITDGSKDLTINALTCAGAVSFQGNVTLGNGTPDDITVSGSLASTVPIKTNNSYDIGSSTIGLASVYYGAPSSRTTRITAHQSLSASNTLILPNGNGSAGQVMRTDGSSTLFFVDPSPSKCGNYSLSASVATNALTVTLNAASGSAASSSNPIDIVFRSSTATTGTPVIRQVTSAITVTVSSGSTLGHASAVNQYVHVYAIDNAGTVELAVAGSACFDENTLQSTTSEGGAGAADSGVTLYSTTARANVAVRYLGRLKSNQATAGTWASAISEISIAHRAEKQNRSEVWVTNGNGYGSVGTATRCFSTTQKNVGTAITYTADTTNGDYFTINEEGFYFIQYSDNYNTGGSQGLTLNGDKATVVGSQAITAILAINRTALANYFGTVSTTRFLKPTDIIRAQSGGDTGGTPDIAAFYIAKVSD